MEKIGYKIAFALLKGDVIQENNEQLLARHGLQTMTTTLLICDYC
jgi:hypothetical protein